MKKTLIAIFLVTTLLFNSNIFSQTLEDKPTAAALFNEGNKLKNSGDYSGAIKKFDEALKIVDDYRLYYAKADTYRKSKQYQEAISLLKKTIEKDKSYYPAYFYLGSSYFAIQDFENAKKYFDETLKHTKDKKIVSAVQKNLDKINEQVTYSILVEGQNNLSNGDINSAINKFNEVLKVYNSDAAYLNLADAHIELGQYDKAIDYASKAIAHQSTISKGSAYFFIGLAHKKLGNNEKAVANLQSCLDDRSKGNIYRDRAKFELDQIK